jgi:hypothetical protein
MKDNCKDSRILHVIYIYKSILMRRNMYQFYFKNYCCYSEVAELVFCIILKVCTSKIQRNVFRENFTKVFGYITALNNMRTI